MKGLNLLIWLSHASMLTNGRVIVLRWLMYSAKDADELMERKVFDVKDGNVSFLMEQRRENIRSTSA